MLVIRSEQIKVFSNTMLRSFEERMLTHILKCFPKKYNALGQEAVVKLIHQGIKRAETYNIHTERNVAEFIDLMIVFGSDFDTDDAYPAAKKILKNADFSGQEKIDALYAMFNDIPESEL